jgi:hypothetical protein
MFGRSKEPPSRELLAEKCDSLRPGTPLAEAIRSGRPTPERVLAPEDVTGVINLALERLDESAESGRSALEAATARLLDEAAAAQELAVQLTKLPPPPPLPVGRK